ncbi:HAD family hydrolase [Salimicrobium flavidum]|uniref:HAD-superfamily subfamily IB hydrolase, TIGR01490 n=1 Tax=Salimicrobium flavidum TaxID=570947 RepID=A0A1N7KBR4_9BACI|nr:HAD-IB family hydrolase [Salimicrobium flavidum]SIS59012.1 HAD-superfamily subfamily IB hydrolase, TIGR01490 [Salimicrobium flavidum]
MRVAIFDFDRTLFPEETFPLMMNHLKTHPMHHKKYSTFMRKILPMYVAYKLKLYPEEKMREGSMQSYISAFTNSSREDVEKFFAQLANQMKKRLNPEILHRLEWHKARGDYTVLVSGAFQPMLETVTHDLPFDLVLGTEVPYSENYIDSKAHVHHVNGKRKMELVKKNLILTDIDWKNSYAYGDSYSDLDVLESVGNPVAVQPEPRLEQVAENGKWEIITPVRS